MPEGMRGIWPSVLFFFLVFLTRNHVLSHFLNKEMFYILVRYTSLSPRS